MAVRTKGYKAALERLNAYLREHENLRPSKVRNLVLEQVCKMPQPFTADQLLKACEEERISIGTIYHSLEMFVMAQILHASSRQRGFCVTEYELAIGTPVRMYIICDHCGRKTEFHDKAISRLLLDRKYANFNMQQVTLNVFGVCKTCRKPKNKAEN